MNGVDYQLDPALQALEQPRQRIERFFDDYLEWVEETMTTEEHPYLQVIAAVQG